MPHSTYFHNETEIIDVGERILFCAYVLEKGEEAKVKIHMIATWSIEEPTNQSSCPVCRYLAASKYSLYAEVLLVLDLLQEMNTGLELIINYVCAWGKIKMNIVEMTFTSIQAFSKKFIQEVMGTRTSLTQY